MEESSAPASIGLLSVAAAVDWLDAAARAKARQQSSQPARGALGELAEWLAAVQGVCPPSAPSRPRLVRRGGAAEPADSLAAEAGVGVRTATITSFAEGVAVADAEVDAGCDLLIVSGTGSEDVTALAVSSLTHAEPVAMLPRGAAAIDTKSWIARAEFIRDRRATLMNVRDQPDQLLSVLDDDAIAGLCGLIVRAAARRTAVLLDGDLAATAALIAFSAQPRCALWWRVADTSTSPVQTKALEAFRQRPILDLGIEAQDGTAAVLALAMLRAAVAFIAADHAGG